MIRFRELCNSFQSIPVISRMFPDCTNIELGSKSHMSGCQQALDRVSHDSYKSVRNIRITSEQEVTGMKRWRTSYNQANKQTVVLKDSVNFSSMRDKVLFTIFFVEYLSFQEKEEKKKSINQTFKLLFFLMLQCLRWIIKGIAEIFPCMLFQDFFLLH